MNNFSIKKRNRIFNPRIIVAFLSIVIFIAIGFTIDKDDNSVNADSDTGSAFGYDDGLIEDDIEIDLDNGHMEPDPTEYKYQEGCEPGGQCGMNDMEPDEYFVAKYDSSNPNDCPNVGGCVSNQENQKGENLCWAYSYTSTVENNLMRTKNTHMELSVKQLDYLLSDNFSDSTNQYYNRLKTTIGLNRTITNASNFTFASIVSTGKYALITEDSFWSNLQDENASLSSYSNYANYLKNNTSGYRQKISSTSTLNEDSTSYTIDSYESATGYMYYGEEYASNIESVYYSKDALIRHLKDAIKDYGSVAVGTHYDSDNCAYVDMVANTYTYIDRTTRTNKNICDNGHAITLIGWDDTWEYIDNGESKKGAFIVRNSYGERAVKEYFAYDSAITSFFIAKDVEENTYDNTYDYTDYQGAYIKDTSKESGYRLTYSSQNGIVPQDNELIYEFDTGSDQPEKIEKISFSQRLRAAGAQYTVYLSKDNGQTWTTISSLTYSYPGQQTIEPQNDMYVSGKFAIKIVSGRSCFDGIARTLDCSDYTGATITDTEKKYNHVSIFTSDYVEPEEKEEYIITFNVLNSAYGTISQNSITVPKNSKFTTNRTQLLFYDENGTLINTITATPITKDERYNYSVNWSYNSKSITSDEIITAKFIATPRDYIVRFVTYLDDGNETTILRKDLNYGVLPIYNIETPTKTSNDPAKKYVFIGWDKNLSPVTGDVTYYAQFMEVDNTHKITFQSCKIVNGENTCVTLKSSDVTHGQVPVYSDIVVHQYEDDEYVYTFVGWDSEVVAATEDAVYTAVFSSTPKETEEPEEPEEEDDEPTVPDTNDDEDDNKNKGNESGNNNVASDNEGDNGSYFQSGGIKAADTGYPNNNDISISADAYSTLLTLGVIGFATFIIRNRKKFRDQ